MELPLTKSPVITTVGVIVLGAGALAGCAYSAALLATLGAAHGATVGAAMLQQHRRPQPAECCACTDC